MFSSSLRQRHEWSILLAHLDKSPSKWKETQLPNHDLEFPVEGSADHSGTFRIVFVFTQNVDTDAVARNLSHLSKHSVGKRGVVLLMQGHDAMSSFMHIQLQALKYGNISVMPVSHLDQLIAQLESLQNHDGLGVNTLVQVKTKAARRNLLRHCVPGLPLSMEQVDILLSLAKDIRELANMTQTQEGQRQICELLGATDGRRLATYFTHGPKPI